MNGFSESLGTSLTYSPQWTWLLGIYVWTRMKNHEANIIQEIRQGEQEDQNINKITLHVVTCKWFYIFNKQLVEDIHKLHKEELV